MCYCGLSRETEPTGRALIEVTPDLPVSALGPLQFIQLAAILLEWEPHGAATRKASSDPGRLGWGSFSPRLQTNS